MKNLPTLSLFILLSVLSLENAKAKNVDLVTLPNRNAVQLTIYNSEDLTLARETRFVTLKKGENRLQFSWANTLIDPTSVSLRIMAHQDSITVVDTVYPGQKPRHLIWNIHSDVEGQVPVEVTYFTSGLTWKMDYVAIVDPAEATLQFRGYVRVFNNSGEEYENAGIRLIVGKINLVQKIAQLASLRDIDEKDFAKKLAGLKKDAVTLSMDYAEEKEANGRGRAGGKKIVKEGLSEYFMFSVEGTETIRNGWSKRMRAVKAEDVQFDIVYRLRSYQYGPRPVRFFTWNNDSEHKLGDSPLPNGVVRVFRENGQDGLAFLGQQSLNYVPVKADIEVNLGHDDLVVFQRKSDGTRRSDFLFHPSNKNVTGWHETKDWIDSVRNYRAKPIRFELRHRIGGDVEFHHGPRTTLFDFNTVEVIMDVPQLSKTDYPYSMVTRHGTQAKQNRIRLVPQR